jgi:hypothetical protein
MFGNILSLFVIVATVFPVTGTVTAQELSPGLRAFPDQDRVDGMFWPAGEPVSLTINGGLLASQTADATGYVEFLLTEYDLKRGDSLTLSSGDISATHIARQLFAENFDLDTQTMSGTVDEQQTVHVWTGEAELYVEADESGNWSADFSSFGGVLFSGACGNAEAWEGPGSTRCVAEPPPNPFIAVSLTQEWFMGDFWLPETWVTIRVYEFQGATNPALTLNRYTDSAGHLNIEGWEHSWDLEEGNYVVATDGVTTKDLLLAHITLDVFDPDEDAISGTAVPGREVGVGVGHANEERWLNVIADEETGVWSADFKTVGYNVTADMWAGGHVSDQDGDVTAAHNSGRSLAPFPHLVASLTEDWFYLVHFPADALVNLAVYESQGGAALWTGTATTDGSGFVWIDAEGRWDIEPGTYLVASDGTLTKELVAEALTFEVFDTTRGVLDGTAPAPFGRRVWVGFGWDYGGWFMDVATNKKGAWTADFGAPVPNGYNWVAAQIFDADGDASELRPAQTIGRTVTAGNFYVEWSTSNPEEIVELRWNGSGNLTNSWAHPACADDLEFFGNSWASENEGEDLFFFGSVVGWGTTGTWKEQTNTKVKIGSKSSGCPGSAGIPIKTDYRFFHDQLRANLIIVQRMIKFGDIPYAHNVRPFIPRLYPSDGFTQVLHPDASGDDLVTDTTCDFGCVAESWDGSWFAIHNPATGVGMIVQRKPSPYTAALWLDDDDGSFTNSSAILLLHPAGGFLGTVTETEYLCFYDSGIWTPSLTLPAGCQP